MRDKKTPSYGPAVAATGGVGDHRENSLEGDVRQRVRHSSEPDRCRRIVKWHKKLKKF